MKNVISTWGKGEGGFHNVFGDRPIKWRITKRKKKPLKHLCFEMHHNY
jgi:hypothetical protein